MEQLLSAFTTPFILHVEQPMISWCGVPSLIYSGWPISIQNSKKELERLSNSLSLTIHPENSGSRFPKTTLGCLSGEGDPALSSEEVKGLRRIAELCRRGGKGFCPGNELSGNAWAGTTLGRVAELCATCRAAAQQAAECGECKVGKECREHLGCGACAAREGGLGGVWDDEDGDWEVAFSSVQLVGYTRRSLEEADYVMTRELFGEIPEGEENDGSGLQRIDEFLEHRHDEYLPRVQQPGGRVTHYRGPAKGVTLVARLASVPKSIQKFRKLVDQQFPGRFLWFDDSSLHVTIRGLV